MAPQDLRGERRVGTGGGVACPVRAGQGEASRLRPCELTTRTRSKTTGTIAPKGAGPRGLSLVSLEAGPPIFNARGLNRYYY